MELTLLLLPLPLRRLLLRPLLSLCLSLGPRLRARRAPLLSERFLKRELRAELILFNPFTLAIEARKLSLAELALKLVRLHRYFTC